VAGPSMGLGVGQRQLNVVKREGWVSVDIDGELYPCKSSLIFTYSYSHVGPQVGTMRGYMHGG
jgi:hypothetical protein